MGLRYHVLASYGRRTLEQQVRAATLTRRNQALHQYVRQHQSSTSTPSTVHRPLHTTSSVKAPAASMQQQQDDDTTDFEDDDLQRFATSCMKEMVSKDTPIISMHDELGKASVWDKPLEELLDVTEDKPPRAEASSTGSQTLSSPELRGDRIVPHDLLTRFDPTNPPETIDDLQLWLECEAQQEHVLRYQKVIQSARKREDYTSLGVVQKQVLDWYQPVKTAIEEEQARYLMGGMQKKKKDMVKYGPHLCSIPAEKLAILLSHETILHCLMCKNANGASLASTAKRIGIVVEAELNVQRLLQKRAHDKKATEAIDKFGESLEDFVKEDGTIRIDEQAAAMATVIDDDEDNPASSGYMYAANHLQSFTEEISKDGTRNGRLRVEYANSRARALLDNTDPWSTIDQVKLGCALLEILLKTATTEGANGKTEKTFKYHKTYQDNKSIGWISAHDELYNMVMEDSLANNTPFSTRHKPMILPPNPWVSPQEGGYKWLQVDIMRMHGSKIQADALWAADLSTAFDGLNVLGSIAWKINKTVLDVGMECWRTDVVIGDIPSKSDFEVPFKPIKPDRCSDEVFQDRDSEAFKSNYEVYTAYKDAQKRYDRMKQKNMDLRSLRCSAILKLDQAEKFQDFEEIFFPYNMDFRGRAYPVPPHLSNVGSDLCRGLLTFSKTKALGKRGLYWLKVHLANLAGNDKITFEERASFTEKNMVNVRAAVEDPHGENRWWMTLDDPFQGLATCHEIINAIDSGDPETYECALPVHMDGSCNGLQHYAALGRDSVGGKAVNLCMEDKPQDVYTGVMKEVIRQVANEASVNLDIDETREDLSKEERKALRHNQAAKLVNGLIDRGVVKRTVMTSVYGVTYIGARMQIQEKIEEKLEEKGVEIHEIEHEIHLACGYLASVTMDVMGQLFTGARSTMNWLTACARLIAAQDQPVAWISPIGIPVVQPYRQSKPHTIVTLMQNVVLSDQSDDLPIHKQRQVSAFPPNYIHCLDSSHMLLTSLEMDRRGLHFSAVHDSFWTHACDIDEMNEALRDSFVELYEQPLLEGLKETWELRYPNLQFPDLPARGDLDLNAVKSAEYFFQ